MYNAENELDLPSRSPLGVDANVALCRQLPGFIVPLDFEGMETSEFLLVPYFGACIHVPPPPSNQIVYVKTVAGYPLKELFDPVWVTGEMRTQAYLNEVGDAGYTLQATIIEPY